MNAEELRSRGGRCSVIFFFLFISAMLMFSVCDAAAEQKWKEVKGQHFVVRYSRDAKFAGKVSHRAEKEYKRIMRELGFSKRKDFWRWDDRALITLYASRPDFIKLEGAPKWAVGKADYKAKKIAGLESNEAFLTSVLPHEIGHLVFRDFVGFKGAVPLWLDEGVAQWLDPSAKSQLKGKAERLRKTGGLLKLSSLTMVNVSMLKKGDSAARFYAQSASVVGFMMKKYGCERFTKFCRKLRDGSSLDESLRFAYSGIISNIEDLERQWLKSLGGK